MMQIVDKSGHKIDGGTAFSLKFLEVSKVHKQFFRMFLVLLVCLQGTTSCKTSQGESESQSISGAKPDSPEMRAYVPNGKTADTQCWYLGKPGNQDVELVTDRELELGKLKAELQVRSNEALRQSVFGALAAFTGGIGMGTCSVTIGLGCVAGSFLGGLGIGSMGDATRKSESSRRQGAVVVNPDTITSGTVKYRIADKEFNELIGSARRISRSGTGKPCAAPYTRFVKEIFARPAETEKDIL